MNIQAKLIALLGSVLGLVLLCTLAFTYGHRTGYKSADNEWQGRERERIAKVTQVTLQHASDVSKTITQDTTLERNANERYEIAVGQLSQVRTANRELIAANGGLRISAAACTGRDRASTGSEAESPGVGDGTVAGTIALPQEIDEDLQATADEADVLLERFRTLRQWAIDQGFLILKLPDKPDS